MPYIFIPTVDIFIPTVAEEVARLQEFSYGTWQRSRVYLKPDRLPGNIPDYDRWASELQQHSALEYADAREAYWDNFGDWIYYVEP